jgi:peptidoglycan/LPS O-acetylase OafA/YrhL
MEELRISKNKTIENRNLSLDYSRALAILAVITYHSLNFLGIENSFHGEVGVDAFLFISGYSLVRYNSGYSPQSFLSKRFKRV